MALSLVPWRLVIGDNNSAYSTENTNINDFLVIIVTILVVICDHDQVDLVGLVMGNSGAGVLSSVGRVSRRPSSS